MLRYVTCPNCGTDNYSEDWRMMKKPIMIECEGCDHYLIIEEEEK